MRSGLSETIQKMQAPTRRLIGEDIGSLDAGMEWVWSLKTRGRDEIVEIMDKMRREREGGGGRERKREGEGEGERQRET